MNHRLNQVEWELPLIQLLCQDLFSEKDTRNPNCISEMAKNALHIPANPCTKLAYIFDDEMGIQKKNTGFLNPKGPGHNGKKRIMVF